MRITSTGSRVLRFIKKDLKKRWRDGGEEKGREGKEKSVCVGGGADSDGDLDRYEGKGQWVLKNMKDKDGEQDGFRGKRGKRGVQ